MRSGLLHHVMRWNLIIKRTLRRDSRFHYLYVYSHLDYRNWTRRLINSPLLPTPLW